MKRFYDWGSYSKHTFKVPRWYKVEKLKIFSLYEDLE